MTHRSGFVNIIGLPNVGKSTLMNALVGENMSIITSKAQTTRHRILGIVNGDDFQMVFSDTPGFIKKPAYELQGNMNKFVEGSFEDADIFLFVVDKWSGPQEQEELLNKLHKAKAPLLLIINKIDLYTQEELEQMADMWQAVLPKAIIIPASAAEKANLEPIMHKILELLPEGPAWYDKEELTDRPERFFVSEIIREKIFTNYSKEIPYSCEVSIEAFQEEEALIRILANIYTERKTQKSIIIGKGGEAIKKVGIEARKDIEAFVGKQVYLELYVKVKEDWRDNPNTLKGFGYQ